MTKKPANPPAGTRQPPSTDRPETPKAGGSWARGKDGALERLAHTADRPPRTTSVKEN